MVIFHKIQHEKVAEAIIRQLEDLILEGVLRPGDQLPPERELAKKLDVSRPSLRAATKELEQRGLLIARQGGGTYVADVVGSVFSEPIIYLFRSHKKATADYLEFRREIDMIAAGYAAERATDADREILKRVHSDMSAAFERSDQAEAIRLDIEFHKAVVDAAHNIVLLHTMRSMYELLVSGVFYDRLLYYHHEPMRDVILEQHQAILDAIIGGNADAARGAARVHVTFVEETLAAFERSGTRERTAGRRLGKTEATSDKNKRQWPVNQGNRMTSPPNPSVALFVTCLVDLFRPAVGFASVKLLEDAGCRVDVPEAQTCCGQPAFNSGDRADTTIVALQVIEAFEGYDYVVAPSGSCAGMIRKHYPELFQEGTRERERADALAGKTWELMAFLVDEMGVSDVEAKCNATATYHDSCSGLRELGVKAQPRKLLASVDGLEPEGNG